MLMTVLRGSLAIRQLLGCANCAQIASKTAQNTREISVMAHKTIFVFDNYVGVKTLDLLRGIARNDM